MDSSDLWCALQGTEDDRWDFTYQFDGGTISPADSCEDHEVGHATQEEAERCWYEYELSQVEKVAFLRWHTCQHHTCKKRTWTGMGIREYPHWGTLRHLCDTHMNMKVYKKLYPFKADIILTDATIQASFYAALHTNFIPNEPILEVK